MADKNDLGKVVGYILAIILIGLLWAAGAWIQAWTIHKGLHW